MESAKVISPLIPQWPHTCPIIRNVFQIFSALHSIPNVLYRLLLLLNETTSCKLFWFLRWRLNGPLVPASSCHQTQTRYNSVTCTPAPSHWVLWLTPTGFEYHSWYAVMFTLGCLSLLAPRQVCKSLPTSGTLSSVGTFFIPGILFNWDLIGYFFHGAFFKFNPIRCD